jgi:phosphatidylethanolamine/phosphatidyl-N-methylethanolamine N-methyltransferase
MPRKSSIASFYNSVTFVYPVINVFLRKGKRSLIQEINSMAIGKLLEIGVGTGDHLQHYKNHKITAIDISNKMLTRAKRRAGEDIILLEMDGENLLFTDQSFEYVVLSHVIAVVADQKKLFLEVDRVLKVGGKILILNHFSPQNYLGTFDLIFNSLSKILHFKSFFRVEDIVLNERFKLIKQKELGLFSYFKILIYEKVY